ncbi:T9SS type A sorting domain-containing protein, partial [Arthrospira platensis SPKY1]|nr:T9SS type A sorting domain-containing protein [Arthrospira platensis SPKY1]
SLQFTDANGCQGETPPLAVTISSTVEVPAEAMRVYPNPAGDVLFVESDQPIARIRLLDQQGRVLWDAEPSGSGEAHIPLDRFSAGTYGLQVVLTDGRQWARLVVKGE